MTVLLGKNLTLMWVKVLLVWQGPIIGFIAKLFDTPGILSEEFPKGYKDS
jgi:hypothetical protein